MQVPVIQLTGEVGPRQALAIYLQDHHASATGAVALVRRAARNQRDTRAGAVLGRLTRELEEDRGVVARVMEQFGVQPSPLKATAAGVAERAGRLKLNGVVVGSSPLSPIVELEGLLLAVRTIQHLWILLRDAADVEIEGVDLDHMVDRATRQIDQLEGLWREAAVHAFGGDAPPEGGAGSGDQVSSGA